MDVVEMSALEEINNSVSEHPMPDMEEKMNADAPAVEDIRNAVDEHPMLDVEERKSADVEQPRNNSFSMTAPVIGMGMSRSYSPESLLKNIKGLLATGLLEGLSVTYKNNGVEMVGRIHQQGYLCGCPICNYSTVLSAHKFEKHLGQSSNNQNDHIFLDSGITLYSVLQALKYTRLHLLGDMIEERIGLPPNLKQFEEWKSSFQVDNDEPDVDTFDPCSVQRTNSTPSGLDTVDGIEERTVEEIKNGVGKQPRNNGLSATAPVKGLKTKRKVNPQSILENVRGLLATGLLEGFSVTYKNNRVEMVGRIHQQGYLCGCPICNYSTVLSAREFEKHSGESSNNQNDHIFLDSGITLYSVLQALKHTRLHLLGHIIEERIGLPPNLKQFEEWKSSFQVDNDEPDVDTSDPCSIQRANSTPSGADTVDGIEERTMEEIKNEVGEQPMNNGLSMTTPVKELRTVRKVNLESVLEDVTGLLATGLLEGCSVTYKRNEVEMSGTIDQQGYRCGCSCCNYSNVLSAYEFEKHSGESSNNQNDHIFLDSGISLYRVLQVLKGTRLHLLGDVIEEKIGLSPNWKQFEEWKASFQADSDDSDVAAYDPCSIERDDSLHQLIFKEGSLPDGTPLMYKSKGEVLLTGHKRGTCIICTCHNIEFSPSQFERHAGKEKKRQPYHSIYTPEGLTLHEQSVKLHHGMKLNGGGCVISSTIHERSEPNHSGSGIESSTAARSTIVLLKRTLQERVIKTESCYLCGNGHTTVGAISQDTIVFCNQCERPCHIKCYSKGNKPKKGPMEVLVEYAQFHFMCCEKCQLLRASLYQRLEKHKEKAFAGEGSTNAEGVNICWHLFSAMDTRSNMHRFIPQVIEIFKDAFSETAAEDNDIIPNMVNAKDLSGERDFRGMYCAVVIARMCVVSAAILKVRTQEVAELVLIATHSQRRRKGYFRFLLGKIEAQLTAWGVQLLTAPIDPETVSIWSKKLGFTISSEEQKRSLLEAHPILMFENLRLAQKSLA